MDTTHAAMVRSETAVSVAINALVPMAIIRAIGVPPPATLFGFAGLIRGVVLASGVATLLMTVIVTLLVRARLDKRLVRPLPLTALGWPARALPKPLVLRALTMAVVAVVVLVPSWLMIVAAFDLLPATRAMLAVFNLVLGTSVGLTMTPWVVLRAFADSPR